MLGVTVSITQYIDDAQPGWVECKLLDAWGHEWLFKDKVPMFTSLMLDKHSTYPQSGVIACQVVKKYFDADGKEIITIDTQSPWYVESTTGETRFDVSSEQLIEFDFDE